jgi:hypothetical protein
MHGEVEVAEHAAVLAGQPMVAEVVEAAAGQLAPPDAALQGADALQEVEVAVAVVRREDLLVLAELPRDGVHLRRLVERAADEEQLLSSRA